MTITREDFVSQSIDTYLRGILESKGYTDDTVEILPSFPHERFDDTPLSKSYVASGYNFDDGGKQVELGSKLIERLYTIEFFVIGQSETWARTLANAVKFALETDLTIPLLDVTVTEGERPQIDTLPVASVSAEHQPVPDPKPWQEHIWTVHLRVEDIYYAGSTIS